MKMILKKITLLVLLSGLLSLQLSAVKSDEAMVADVVRFLDEVESSKTTAHKATEQKKSQSFFLKDSKLHTAFRCALGLGVLALNGACGYIINQNRIDLAGPSLSEEGKNKSKLSIATGIFALLFMNGAFADFYLSEVNHESTEKE